jgi:hypothetical protein
MNAETETGFWVSFYTMLRMATLGQWKELFY